MCLQKNTMLVYSKTLNLSSPDIISNEISAYEKCTMLVMNVAVMGHLGALSTVTGPQVQTLVGLEEWQQLPLQQIK